MVSTIKRQLVITSKEEESACEIISRLRGKGFEAFMVGGAIRDRLLGKIPHEVDVATDASPSTVQTLFSKTIAVGAAFGVVIVVIDGIQIEVATFREDAEYMDGRHPSAVKFSNAEHDAQRRDFTINALFYDPCSQTIIDYVNGIEDLNNGVIKAIGNPDDRFSEDYLRMMRAIRFSAQLEFDIDPNTYDAILKHGPGIVRISTERQFDELTKILIGSNPDRAFTLLDETGLLKLILPEAELMKGVKQPPEFHPEGDVWIHTLLMLQKMTAPTRELAWSILFHDIGKPPTFAINKHGRESFPSHAKEGAHLADKILKRFHCSKEFMETINTIVYYHMSFADVKNMKRSTLRRMLARKTFMTELELHRIDCLSSHCKLGNYMFLQEKMAEFTAEPPIPEPLLRGHDILARGLREGPKIGAILRELEERQLNSEINTRQEALAWLEQRVHG